MRTTQCLLVASLAVSGLSVSGCTVHAYTGDTPPPDTAPGAAGNPHPESARIQHIRGNNYMLKSSGNQGLCVDAQGDHPANGTRMQLYGCHGRENQRWSFTDRAENSSSITGIGGLCLDVIGGQTTDGAPLQLYACGNQTNQGFRHFADGRIRELQTGKCLTASPAAQGTALTIARCDWNNQGQVWVLSQ